MFAIFGLFWLILCPFCVCVGDARAEGNHESVHQLVDKLFQGYDSGLRPSSPRNGTIVTAAFQIQQLLDVVKNFRQKNSQNAKY